MVGNVSFLVGNGGKWWGMAGNPQMADFRAYWRGSLWLISESRAKQVWRNPDYEVSLLRSAAAYAANMDG